MSFWKKMFGQSNNVIKNFTSVTIGNQEWLTENLNADKFRNGDSIPEIKSNLEWEKAGNACKPAWCYYDNNPSNGKIYGKLYNWFAVNDPRGLVPEKWHIPNDEEWRVLTEYLGGKEIEDKLENEEPIWYSTNAGGIMKSIGTNHWKSPNEKAINSCGFSGLPGGFRFFDGDFGAIGFNGFWWSSSEYSSFKSWIRYLNYNNGNVNRNNYNKSFGLSVRCLRD